MPYDTSDYPSPVIPIAPAHQIFDPEAVVEKLRAELGLAECATDPAPAAMVRAIRAALGLDAPTLTK